MKTILSLVLLVVAAGYYGSEAQTTNAEHGWTDDDWTTDDYEGRTTDYNGGWTDDDYVTDDNEGWTTHEYDDGSKGWVSCGCHDAPSCRQCGSQPHLCNGDCTWTWSGCRRKHGPGPTRPPPRPTGETPVSMGTRPPPTWETPVYIGSTGESRPPPSGGPRPPPSRPSRPPPTGESRPPPSRPSRPPPSGGSRPPPTGESRPPPTGPDGTTAEGCPAPVKHSSPRNGYWFCAGESCHLECNPGYASTNRTSIYQTSDCSWSIPPESLTCSPAVALIIGGLIDATGAEVYGPGIHARLPDLPDTRVGGSLDYVDSFIIACGGSLITFPPKPPFPPARNNCIEMSNNLTWSHHSTMHQSRDLQANAVNLGKLTLLGGTDAPTSQDTIQPGKSSLWEENTIKKTKYSCAAKISATEFIVTAGEYNPNETLKYNTLTGEITKLADLNQERSGHGCAFVKYGSMAGVIVSGGLPMGNQAFTENVANITTGSTEIFSTETNEWRTLGSLNMPRRGLKLVFVQDQLYALGGFNGTVYVATVEKFNFENETWSFAEDMFAPRAFAGVAAVPRDLFSDNN